MARFDPLMLVESTECPPHEGLPAVAVRERGFVATELTLLFTITQQTAKNLFLWEGRSFVRKGLEAWFVFLMEGFWPKKRILEVYPNIVEFGDGVYGVHSAAVIFFDKEPSHLTRREAALLAAVLPNPKRFSVTAPSRYIQQRIREIERQMNNLGSLHLEISSQIGLERYGMSFEKKTAAASAMGPGRGRLLPAAH